MYIKAIQDSRFYYLYHSAYLSSCDFQGIFDIIFLPHKKWAYLQAAVWKNQASTSGTIGNVYTSLKSAGPIEELAIRYRLKLTSNRFLEGKAAALLAHVYVSLLRCAFRFWHFSKSKSSSFLRGGITTFPYALVLQAHKGAKILAQALNVRPLLALRYVDPVIHLVMDYLICFHVCHNYVIIMMCSVLSYGIKMLIFFFNFQSDSEEEKLVKASSSWRWSRFGTLTFLRLPASKQEQNSEQHTKVTYYTNLIICIYLGGSKHLLALCEVRMPMAMSSSSSKL